MRLKLMLAETFVDACLIMAGAKLEMDEWTHLHFSPAPEKFISCCQQA